MHISSTCKCEKASKVYRKTVCTSCWFCDKCGTRGCDDLEEHLKGNESLEINQNARKNINGENENEKFDTGITDIYSTDS